MTHDRRQFIRSAGLAAAGGSAAWLAACGGGGDGKRRPAPTANPAADVQTLNAVLDLEHLAAAVYPLLAAELTGAARARARAFAAHERAHAERLSEEIRALGGAPNQARPAAVYAELTAGVRGERAALRFAADLERTALVAYEHAVPRLSTGRLRRLAGSILACQAEHLAVLLGALGEPQAAAFPTTEAAR